MKGKILTIVLVISLAFNGFFALGYFQAHRHRRAGKRFHSFGERIAKKLDLDDQQYQLFSELRENGKARRQIYLGELMKDEPDQKLLERLSLERLANMQKFIGMLRPEQKQALTQMCRKRFGSGSANSSPPEE